MSNIRSIVIGELEMIVIFQHIRSMLTSYTTMLTSYTTTKHINPMFGNPSQIIPFHSILFHFFNFLILQTILFHSIFFQPCFQLFKSLYNIFKSRPFIPPRNSQSQTILLIFLTIFKPFWPPLFGEAILAIPSYFLGWKKWFGIVWKWFGKIM